MIPTEADRMQAARDARVRIGEDTDYKLYGAISKKPGSSVYDLANELRWSAGKVYGSLKRLEKDGWIRTEKAESAGREVVLVNPAYTSQICSSCGTIVKKDLSERVHSCPKCGLVMDRDLNAAKNILRLGLQSVAKA